MSAPGSEPLDTDIVLRAYRLGFFPMADAETGTISWYSPDPRAIIPLDQFKISRSLRKVVDRHVFDVLVDSAFPEVIKGCSERGETWISAEIIDVYTDLHRKGLAHSIEAWRKGALVGGLYGVAIGGAFFGESMFSRVPNASKVALVHLVNRLVRCGFQLLDTQFLTPHLASFGAREIPKAKYLQMLARALRESANFRGLFPGGQ